MHKDLPRWVVAKDIAKDMPLGTAPCASGSGSERGLQPDTIKVHRAVCLLFPSVTRYGGMAGRGEHATGQAIDIMVGIATDRQRHRRVPAGAPRRARHRVHHLAPAHLASLDFRLVASA